MKPSSRLLLLCLSLTLSVTAHAQDAPDINAGPITHTRPAPKSADTPDPPPAPTAPVNLPPTPVFDKTLFSNPVPAADLTFLKQYDGARSKDLYRDKQFKGLRKATLPNWMYHYGRDMSVSEALDWALSNSNDAVAIRENRYVTLSGSVTGFMRNDGRALIWVDMQDGLVLAAFYFRPTNGEPTPTVTVFSKQLAVDAISMDQLPPEFFKDYSQWCADERIPPITFRYFIGALNQRVLLAHDEDFCSATFSRLGNDCLQMTADAADTDMTTAYYLDQVHYATNATAWLITGADQTSFIAYRTNACGSVADPLGCRIRLTRTQITRIGHPTGIPHPIHR